MSDKMPTAHRNELDCLLQYGYAPGHYMNTCRHCGEVARDVDKRAITCRPCAEAKHAAREFTPADIVRMNEGYRQEPRICGS